MRLVRIVLHRLRSLLRAARGERDMERELALHLDQITREYMLDGMSEADARRAARRDFGALESIKEQCRDTRRVALVQDLFKDLRYAGRLFARAPGFTVAAVLSLGLGIGATAAIFTLVDAVLMRTLPVRAPAQLVEVGRAGGRALSYPTFEAVRDRNQVFSGILLTSAGRFVASLYLGTTSGGDVEVSPVSGDYFDVLGVAPAIGRALTPADVASSNAAVISDRLRERMFGRDPNALGRIVRIGSRNYTIVGVAPPGFSGVLVGQTIDVWVPISWFAPHYLENPAANMFRTIGRLRPGVSPEQVRANLDVIAAQLSAEWGLEQPLRMEAADASGGLTLVRRRFSGPLWVLMTVVVLLLLIAAVNVANLLLARAGARRREMAMRLSLGAGRSRLVRQLLTESALLGGAGAAVGLLLAPAAAASLVRFLSSAMGTMELRTDVDVRVLAFTLTTSMFVVILFGLAPALAATRVELASTLKGGRADAGGRRIRRGMWLVAAQVAISCVLLAGAILFARSLQALANVEAGFTPEGVLLMNVAFQSGAPIADADRVRAYDRAVERLARVPGVRAAAFSSEPLFGGGTWTEPITTASFTPSRGQDREAILLVVSPGFFQTLGTRVLRGRAFDRRDDERGGRVAIVNEAAARYYFGRTDAVGETLQIGGSPPPMAIAGVVEDTKYHNLREPSPRIVYLPALQMPGPVAEPSLAIRTTGDPLALADTLWNEAHQEVPGLRWRGVTTQAALVRGTTAPDRMLAQLSGAVGLTALGLVCIGLYGVTAYEASRRTAEIGVRVALGAGRAQVIGLIVGRAMVVVIGGLVTGVAGAAALARLLEGLLFGIRSSDAVTLAGAPALLLAVAAFAAYWPARRAARLNPVVALRDNG